MKMDMMQEQVLQWESVEKYISLSCPVKHRLEN